MAKRKGRHHGRPSHRQLRRAGLKALRAIKRDARGRFIERRIRGR